MVAGLESLVLASEGIPIEGSLGVAGIALTACIALWRRNTQLEDQRADEIKRVTEAGTATIDALNLNTQIVKELVDAIADLRGEVERLQRVRG